MDNLNIKLRYLVVGAKAPKNSRFKGIVTPDKIFGNEKNQNEISYFDYTTRESAKDDNVVEKKYFEDFFSYTSRKEAKENNITNTATFTNIGFLDNTEKINLFRNISKKRISKKGSCVYELVISFKTIKDMYECNLYNNFDWANKILKLMPTISKEFGINFNNLSFWCDLHDKGDKEEIHPHIHLLFFEKIRTKEIGKDGISKRNLKSIKKETIKKLIIDDIQKDLFPKIDLLKKQIKNEIKAIDFTMAQNINLFLNKLSINGRLSYNSIHIKPYRKELDDIVDNIIKTDLKESYYSLMKVCVEYDSLLNKNSSAKLSNIKDTEEKRMRTFIANQILKLKKEDINFDLNYKKLDEKYLNNHQKNKNTHLFNFSKKNYINDKTYKEFIKNINYNSNLREYEIQQEIDEFFKNQAKMF